MQKIFSVLWSMDSKYIFTGSDETNIWAWKADASEKQGVASKREDAKKNYDWKLIEKFQYNSEVKRVMKTHVPKYLLTAKRKQHIQTEKKHRKQENVRYNNNEEDVDYEAETKRKVVKMEE